jgi:hypothetical protein
MSSGIQSIRSALAPAPAKEQLMLKEMPALRRSPDALTANIREVMQSAAATRGTGQRVDKVI